MEELAECNSGWVYGSGDVRLWSGRRDLGYMGMSRDEPFIETPPRVLNVNVLDTLSSVGGGKRKCKLERRVEF